MQTALTRSNEQVAQIIASLQGLITELRPAALDQLGIAAAADALVERVSSRSGLQIELDVDLDYEAGRAATRHSADLEAAVYRLVQEALSNVVKHADAHTARVRIEEEDELVRVTVEDDGHGFDPAALHSGFGLLGMKERVALLGGEIEIAEADGGGTRVTVTLPVERRDS